MFVARRLPHLSSIRVAQSTVVNHVPRSFLSSGTHDDFMPKKKETTDEQLKPVLDLIDKQVKENPIMLYMKGTPAQPQCGFSLTAVRILNAVGVDFSSVNVLEYPAVREGVKLYSDWPTLPQLYVSGEFVGGCDVMSSMYKDGQLLQLMKDKKLVQ
jgi:monothiol glutaredoxin